MSPVQASECVALVPVRTNFGYWCHAFFGSRQAARVVTAFGPRWKKKRRPMLPATLVSQGLDLILKLAEGGDGGQAGSANLTQIMLE